MRYFFLFIFLLNFSGFSQTKSKLKLKKFKVASIEAPLYETSGLASSQNILFSINDGGNPSHLYTLDSIGKIIQTTTLPFPNTDWEAITTDDHSLYIGDFGNNSGKRDVFTIFKIKTPTDSTATFSKIRFTYQNQTDNLTPYQHDFDCEAMVYHNQQIHIFTKNWLSNTTTHYSLSPLSTDIQNLQALENYATNYLVTDTCIHQNTLYLIGYTRSGSCFLSSFELEDGKLFFSKPLKKHRLGSVLKLGQIEGITATDQGLYISAEGIKKSFLNIKPTLYFIPFSALKD